MESSKQEEDRHTSHVQGLEDSDSFASSQEDDNDISELDLSHALKVREVSALNEQQEFTKRQYVSEEICQILRDLKADRELEGFNSCISNIEFSIMCDCIEVRGSSKEDVEKCWLVIKGTLIDTLSRINVPVSNEKDKFIVRESPRRAKIIRDNNCCLSSFEGKLVLSSLSLNNEKLEEVRKLIAVNNTWSLPWRNHNHQHSVYNHIHEYLSKCLQRKKELFGKNGVKVEMNNKKSCFFIDGPSTIKVKEAKGELLDIVHSTQVMEIKTNSLKDAYKRLLTYLSVISQHPIILKPGDGEAYVLVSSNRVVRELLAKDKWRSFMKYKDMYSVGIFILELSKQSDKFESVREFAESKKFFIEKRGIYYYLINSIKHQDSNADADLFLKFMTQLIEHLMKLKDKRRHLKMDAPKPGTERQYHFEGFYDRGDQVPYEDTQYLIKQFGCDIRMTRLYLNPKHTKMYDCMIGEQTRNCLFNVVESYDPSRINEVQIEKRKMQGSYFYGRVKRSEDGKVYLPQYLIEVL